MKKSSANIMKMNNMNNIRQVMMRVKTATKPQLAALTNLSVVTVNSLIKELIGRGEIVEDKIAPSSGGRPALTYRYDYNHSLALVITMREKQGQEVVSAAVINLENRTLLQEEHVVPALDRQTLFHIIEPILAAHSSIHVIGIGIPGQVVNGEITISSHQELTGFRMIDEIESHFGIPVIVENDINAAISGYCAQQQAEQNSCALGIYFPFKYPPGMGIHLNGNVVKGKNGMAGEIKFLPFKLDWLQPMEHDDFLQAVCLIIQTVNAVLAPDKIVIYQDRVEPGVWQSAWKAYQQEHVMPSYPEVVQHMTFQEDFAAGMRWLALKAIETTMLDSELDSQK